MLGEKGNSANQPHIRSIKMKKTLPRQSSKRYQLLKALVKPAGLSLAQVKRRFEWTAKDAGDALRLLQNRNGIRVRSDGDGRLHANLPPSMKLS